MNREQASNVFREQNKKGKYVFSSHDLRKLFSHESYKAFNEGLKRLVKSGALQHACRNIYVNCAYTQQCKYGLKTPIFTTTRRLQ